MSQQPLAPRPVDGVPIPLIGHALQKPRKISTACLACKQRKTKCSGGSPCSACGNRRSDCAYDVSADQRRKIANRRNVQELGDALDSLERHRQLLGGIIATIHAGNSQQANHLISLIKTGVDMSQLAAHVRNGIRSNIDLQRAYESMTFDVDVHPSLPSPDQLLYVVDSRAFSTETSNGSGSSSND